ncbi:MAG: hypothetical protein NXY57DRAFT_686795 [Lentinula lateritia]|uniref:Uncharacterized protein n=1 Tax=Lentinula lateritia TaxID=40482 RepID=A0ABQ8VH76_9AGAR|nr:MAG: hypothetical protein NXY57DRAFT_686795 [Lentinula lateritia]KAJ4494285.1 hypothetical protein C8R41DRAFT_310843 [Lentinula lateritia]
MLKRQRAPSPPPSSSSNVPLISDSTPVENARSTKRRRTQPPVLDGQMRGWGTPQDVLYEISDREEDDGEEDLVDDDQSYSAPGTSGGANPNSPYKSANGFLHKLHTLQRQRLLYSSNASPQSPSSNHLVSHSSPQQVHAYNSHFYPPGKGPSPPISHPISGHAQSQQGIYALLPYATDPGKQHELTSVKGHYEEKNRLLGSVVLCRRRELEQRLQNNYDT